LNVRYVHNFVLLSFIECLKFSMMPPMTPRTQRDQIPGQLEARPLIRAMMDFERPGRTVAQLAALARPLSRGAGFAFPSFSFEIVKLAHGKGTRQPAE
jgi:hypothetical protein